jgi:hypothetical protein
LDWHKLAEQNPLVGKIGFVQKDNLAAAIVLLQKMEKVALSIAHP